MIDLLLLTGGDLRAKRFEFRVLQISVMAHQDRARLMKKSENLSFVSQSDKGKRRVG